MLDYVALGVIFFLLILITVAIVLLGSLPGKIARRRGHPWPDAVNAASWIGLATGVLWPLAFVWAFLPLPTPKQQSDGGGATNATDSSEDKKRIAALEARVAELQAQNEERTV